jgi:hypothetical protein
MHAHGEQYRARITDSSGTVEFSEWFNTEEELRLAMGKVKREPSKLYQCESMPVRCGDTGCDVEQGAPKVISTL